jgi:hypothetical protein
VSLVPQPPNYPPLIPAPPTAPQPPARERGFDFRWLRPAYNGTALAAALLIPLGPAPPAVWCAITYAAAWQDPVQYAAAGVGGAWLAVKAHGAAHHARAPQAVTATWTWAVRVVVVSAATGALMFIPALTAIVHTLTGAQL